MWIAAIVGLLVAFSIGVVLGAWKGRSSAAWVINELREENDALGEKLDAAYKELADGKN